LAALPRSRASSSSNGLDTAARSVILRPDEERIDMSAIAIAGIAFASIVAVTLLGMLLRSLVPDRYLSAESKEVVGLATALIATMSAVLLGLLISSTRTSYEEKRTQVIRMTADLIELDLLLKDYGPEARRRGGPCAIPCQS
jgi:predicted membrane protein